MLHRTAQLGLVLCLGLVILAWGTSPCLFASMLSADGGCGAAVEDCGCGCCSEEPSEAPASGTDECPTCSTVGNMHQLLPLGDKVALDAPNVALAALPAPEPACAAPSSATSHELPVRLEPPRVQFCTTVALLR